MNSAGGGESGGSAVPGTGERAESPDTVITPTTNADVEKGPVVEHAPHPAVLDIEHAVVEDDPRQWSRTRKVRPPWLALLCSVIHDVYTPPRHTSL